MNPSEEFRHISLSNRSGCLKTHQVPKHQSQLSTTFSVLESFYSNILQSGVTIMSLTIDFFFFFAGALCAGIHPALHQELHSNVFVWLKNLDHQSEKDSSSLDYKFMKVRSIHDVVVEEINNQTSETCPNIRCRFVIRWKAGSQTGSESLSLCWLSWTSLICITKPSMSSVCTIWQMGK